jgi:hypothetical protein
MCNEKIQLTVQEYEKIRAQPTCFVVHVGHDVPGVETVVETNERYALVKKLGAGERVAEKTGPPKPQLMAHSATLHWSAAP